jgi:hypothetical protein
VSSEKNACFELYLLKLLDGIGEGRRKGERND